MSTILFILIFTMSLFVRWHMSIEFTIKHQPGGHKLCIENGLKWSADQISLQKTCFLWKSPKTHMCVLHLHADFNN